MHCCRCREPFEVTHRGLFEDILVYRCVGCRVLWMPAASLDRLDDNVSVKASELEWAEKDETGSLPCPECVGTYRTSAPLLMTVTLPGSAKHPTTAARCSTCGSFLIDEAMLVNLQRQVAGRVTPGR